MTSKRFSFNLLLIIFQKIKKMNYFINSFFKYIHNNKKVNAENVILS